MKRLVLIGMSLIACMNVIALSITINPQAWDRSRSVGQDYVILEPGMPKMPYLPVAVLLPFGEKYQDSYVQFGTSSLQAERVEISLALPQQTISGADMQISHSVPRLENKLYPQKDYEFLGTQYYRGYQVALFNIYPYKYNPISKQVFGVKEAKIELQSTFDNAEARYQAAFVSRDEETLNTLSRWVQNPESISSYTSAASYRRTDGLGRLIDLSNPKEMIIITDAQRVPWFADFAAWKSSKGISNAIYTMEDIVAVYPGEDNAAKLRNFIIDAYQSWASSSEPLQYVILAGDDEIVPERGAYGQVGDTVDLRMPVDMYYSNLDGNWNANLNDIYGEQADNVDMIPEVHIGRFPAESLAEFQNIIRKTMYYADSNSFSNNIALFMGENLNMNPVTWGGDYKDDVAQYLPTSYHFRTLYQRDGTYSPIAVLNAINSGAGIMNHMGHANETSLIGQSNFSVDNMSNTEYGFLYSQGCYPAAFDQRTSAAGESIGEHLLTSSGALFAFIGNTRYGWYMPGSIDGASQFYDRQFFRGLFQQNMPELGRSLTYSRLQNLNAALNNDVMRWCYYEMILFGDPSIAVKSADPLLPLLSLESYSFSDEDGDNDGTLNPGEIIRFRPMVYNEEGWGTASNVVVRVVSAPAGITVLGPCVAVNSILPGGMSPLGAYIQLQLPQGLSYGTYNLKVELESQHPNTQLSTGIKTYNVPINITLLDNRFPWESQIQGKSAPIVGEFAGSAGKEILYADGNGLVSLIGNDGDVEASFSPASQVNLTKSFAMGPIDFEAGADIAFCSRTGDVYAITQSGETIYSVQAPTSFLQSPVLADIDGDGYSETIAGGLDGKVYVYSPAGFQPFGFPVNLGSPFQSELAAADFDSDGDFEIVAGTGSGNLYVINGLGEIMPGFPVNLGAAINGSPTITDTNKIICATSNELFIISPDGQIIHSREVDTHIGGGFAIGNVNHDYSGIDAVGVSRDGVLYAFTDQGIDLPGFPISTGRSFTCPPLLANLDTDPRLEIVLQDSDNSLLIYRHDGTLFPGFPFQGGLSGSTPGTLVDFDNNGLVKFVSGYANGVLMYNLRLPAGGLQPWVSYRGGDMRQGSFASTGCVGLEEEELNKPVSNLMQNFPNPFNPSTTIRYSLATDAKVKLEIFNLKGQIVCTLVDAKQQRGQYSLNWDGKDGNGMPVSSGVYLYRLSYDKQKLDRRMLLLK